MKIFIDSNIFIEYFKDNPEAVKLFESVFRITDVKLYINEIVYSEVTYVFIKTVSGKSYYELKKNKRLVVQHGSNFLNRIKQFLGCSIINGSSPYLYNNGLSLIMDKRNA